MSHDNIIAWPSFLLAVKTLLIERYQPLIDAGADADALVDSDFMYDGGDFFIRLGLVFSQSDHLGGRFTFDLEVFGKVYSEVESRANELDALVLGYPHVVEVDSRKWVFDTVSQNTGPRDLPWEDDSVTRLGATYVITARRR